jgi:hypothetical protein
MLLYDTAENLFLYFPLAHIVINSQDSSADIARSYELDAGVPFPARERNFSILRSV